VNAIFEVPTAVITYSWNVTFSYIYILIYIIYILYNIYTELSEETAASIFRMKMKTGCSSETLGYINQIIRHHIPRYHNVKS
jgi:hypothetical protein